MQFASAIPRGNNETILVNSSANRDLTVSKQLQKATFKEDGPAWGSVPLKAPEQSHVFDAVKSR